jgi:DNA-binding response OmpR family regulator
VIEEPRRIVGGVSRAVLLACVGSLLDRPAIPEVAVNADVLIVDDSPVIADTLDGVLSSQGYRVRTCASGEDGWQTLMEGARGTVPLPDVLLLDLNMPGLDGLTLLGRIRHQEGLSGLPVIIITAETSSETRTEALGAGADDYLCKPVELSELLSRVARWSTQQRAPG